jgi:uncharacterized membrane protein
MVLWGRRMKKQNRSFDPRRHQRQTQIRLLFGGLAIVAIVGGGIVWALYGGSAAVTAVMCLLVAAGVMGLLWLILTLLESWVKEDDL